MSVWEGYFFERASLFECFHSKSVRLSMFTQVKSSVIKFKFCVKIKYTYPQFKRGNLHLGFIFKVISEKGGKDGQSENGRS